VLLLLLVPQPGVAPTIKQHVQRNEAHKKDDPYAARRFID